MIPSPQAFKITRWKESVIAAGCRINTINELHRFNKPDGRHLFSLIDVDVSAPEGITLPRIAFIRGQAVVIVPLLINEQTLEKRFLMVRQRRVGNGLICLEFPAGMLDNPEDDPAEIAIRELHEETGLQVTHAHLTVLSDKPLYSSAGASDESIHYFGCRLELTDIEFNAFSQKIGGNHEENEHITIDLLTKQEAEFQINSIQARLGLFLFEEKFGS